MLTRVAGQRTVDRNQPLVASHGGLVKRGHREVPVDRPGPEDAHHFETARTLKLDGHRRIEWYRPSREQVNTRFPAPVAATRLEYSNCGCKHGPRTAVFMPRLTARRTIAPAGAARAAQSTPLSRDSVVAAEIKALVLAGRRDSARERFAELVAAHQRRATRIAYQYLRDVHDVDEAVQDAFVKVFAHITSYREELPFDVWFTRILVNGCLDLRKARSRRLRWVLPTPADSTPPEPVAPQPSPEDRLLASEQGRRIAAAVEQLPERQRVVFTMCQLAEQTTSEVSQALGLREATVRVHLFRAVRKLRALLERET